MNRRLGARAYTIACIAMGLLLVGLLFAYAYGEVYLYGDDFQKITPQRTHPIPHWGAWIAARVVDDYLTHLMFASFARFVAPVLGLRHIVEIHAVYGALLWALINAGLVLMALAYVRLLVPIRPVLAPVFCLAACALYTMNAQLFHFTLFTSYHLPLLLAAVWLYPFVALFVTGHDVFATRMPRVATLAVAFLGYFVAFSVTNVAFLATISLFVIAGWELMTMRSDGQVKTLSPRQLFVAWFEDRPSWFRLGILLLPALGLLAALFDLNSGRYVREVELKQAAQSISWAQHLAGYASAMRPRFDIVQAIAIPVVVLAFVLGQRGRAASPGALRAGGLLGSVWVAYLLFLAALSHGGTRNYLLEQGLNAPIAYILVMAILGLSFATLSLRGWKILAAVFLVLMTFQGIRSLSGAPQWSPRPYARYSKSELRGVFDSIYTHHCHGVEEVIVYLPANAAVHAGYPIVPDVESPHFRWLIGCYLWILEHFVVEPGTLRDYQPRYVITNDPAVLWQRLAALPELGPRRCLHMEESPYHLSAPGTGSRRTDRESSAPR